MNEAEMKQRTKQFALRVVRLVEALPKTPTAEVIGKQLLRSSTSVAANYRAACRAKSKRTFIYKISLVEEEVDESHFWLEMVVDTGLMPLARVGALIQEANELTAIMTATGRTAKQNRRLRERREGNQGSED